MKHRYIDPDIRRSESVSKLTFRQRDLWYGLILTADDQGRTLAHPGLIRADVWALDDIPLDEVSADLSELEKHEFIKLYSIDKKKYIQILNWKKYQNSAEWLGPSEYPPPEGWEDRYRYHGKERKIIQSDNWVSSPLPKDLETQTSPLPFEDVNDDVNDNDNKEVEEQKTDPAATSHFRFSSGWHLRVFSKVTSMVGIPYSQQAAVMSSLDSLAPNYQTEDEMVTALSRRFKDWESSKTKDGRPYSRTNCAWLTDLAVAGEPLKHERDEENKIAKREYFTRDKPDPNCKVCGGNGVYNKEGRFIKCDCFKGEKK